MTTPQLPEAIVAPIDAFVEELVAWSTAHRDADLDTLEQAVLERLRALAPLLLGGMITVTQRSLDPGMQRDRPACPACGTRARFRGWRSRQLQTVCGVVHWDRPWVQCPTCRTSWSPTDQTLGIAAQQRTSATLHYWMTTMATRLPFREARDAIATVTGLHLGAETIRTVTEAAGTALEAELEAAVAHLETTKEPLGPVESAPDLLVAETDGVMVRYQDGWHEVKLGVVGGWDPTLPKKERHLQAPSYVAARAPVAEWAGRWGAEVARRGGLEEVAYAGTGIGPGLATLRPVVVLGDGAAWIWAAAAEQFDERTEIVDWYHASEHVWTVARAVYGEGTAEAEAWAKASLTSLATRGATGLLKRLRKVRPVTETERKVVDSERQYFQTHEARMRYPEFRAQGLPIGSGAVESSAKHVIQIRMKRAGCRWSDRGGQALVALCAQHATRRAKAA